MQNVSSPSSSGLDVPPSHQHETEPVESQTAVEKQSRGAATDLYEYTNAATPDPQDNPLGDFAALSFEASPPLASASAADDPLPSEDRGRSPPRLSKNQTKKREAQLANQKAKAKKKALKTKARSFAAEDFLLLDDDDMDGQNAATKKDKLDVMNKVIPDREMHEGWMRGAIEMAELALRSDETPVGCVFVHDGKVIARGMNGTNATLNGTRHAEFVALSQILARYPLSVLQQTDLYVTVEPCIMCASALRQFRIRAVYFGCLNERFGGCGGVMRLNSDTGVDPPYPVYGGIFREEAIMLLRRFYVQENEKAPEPKPKKNRELKTEILPVEVAHAAGMVAVPVPPLVVVPPAGQS